MADLVTGAGAGLSAAAFPLMMRGYDRAGAAAGALGAAALGAGALGNFVNAAHTLYRA